jgi:hypothetical protein
MGRNGDGTERLSRSTLLAILTGGESIPGVAGRRRQQAWVKTKGVWGQK